MGNAKSAEMYEERKETWHSAKGINLWRDSEKKRGSIQGVSDVDYLCFLAS